VSALTNRACRSPSQDSGQDGIQLDDVRIAVANCRNLGLSDLAFVGHTLYALVFAGCPRLFENVPSSVVRINSDGSWSIVADLSAYFRTHPVVQPPLAAPDGDFEPDGSPYTMISLGHDLFVAEANSGQLLRGTTKGQITRIIDLSVNHPVPTAVAYYDGNFYLGSFGSASSNGAAVYKISPKGKKQLLIDGLDPVVAVVFHGGKLYALQTFSGVPYSPGTGRLLRLSGSGKIEKTQIIACGLTFPTAMTIGPDGAIYVSNVGYGVDPSAGLGEVLRIPIDGDN
jgi:hypothetical protein